MQHPGQPLDKRHQAMGVLQMLYADRDRLIAKQPTKNLKDARFPDIAATLQDQRLRQRSWLVVDQAGAEHLPHHADQRRGDFRFTIAEEIADHHCPPGPRGSWIELAIDSPGAVPRRAPAPPRGGPATDPPPSPRAPPFFVYESPARGPLPHLRYPPSRFRAPSPTPGGGTARVPAAKKAVPPGAPDPRGPPPLPTQ